MNTVGWWVYFLALAMLVAWIRMRRSGQVAKKEAVELIKHGAMIVDVRAPEEYLRGHLSQAFNMPVEDVDNLVAAKTRDFERPILVHCQSGLRSKKAKFKLERVGYKHVYDLGSYERAFKIVSGRNL